MSRFAKSLLVVLLLLAFYFFAAYLFALIRTGQS
jgi:hypothetical protein